MKCVLGAIAFEFSFLSILILSNPVHSATARLLTLLLIKWQLWQEPARFLVRGRYSCRDKRSESFYDSANSIPETRLMVVLLSLVRMSPIPESLLIMILIKIFLPGWAWRCRPSDLALEGWSRKMGTQGRPQSRNQTAATTLINK